MLLGGECFVTLVLLTKKMLQSYILAGVVLHNYLQQTQNASYCSRGFVDSEANCTFRSRECRQIVRDDAWCSMLTGRYQGCRYEKTVDTRDYINNNEGSLPWQQNYVQRTGRVKEGDWFKRFTVRTMHSKTTFLSVALQKPIQIPSYVWDRKPFVWIGRHKKLFPSYVRIPDLYPKTFHFRDFSLIVRPLDLVTPLHFGQCCLQRWKIY